MDLTTPWHEGKRQCRSCWKRGYSGKWNGFLLILHLLFLLFLFLFLSILVLVFVFLLVIFLFNLVLLLLFPLFILFLLTSLSSFDSIIIMSVCHRISFVLMCGNIQFLQDFFRNCNILTFFCPIFFYYYEYCCFLTLL